MEKWSVNQSSCALDGVKELNVHPHVYAHLDDLSMTNTMSAYSSRLDSREVSTS